MTRLCSPPGTATRRTARAASPATRRPRGPSGSWRRAGGTRSGAGTRPAPRCPRRQPPPAARAASPPAARRPARDQTHGVGAPRPRHPLSCRSHSRACWPADTSQLRELVCRPADARCWPARIPTHAPDRTRPSTHPASRRGRGRPGQCTAPGHGGGVAAHASAPVGGELRGAERCGRERQAGDACASVGQHMLQRQRGAPAVCEHVHARRVQGRAHRRQLARQQRQRADGAGRRRAVAAGEERPPAPDLPAAPGAARGRTAAALTSRPGSRGRRRSGPWPCPAHLGMSAVEGCMGLEGAAVL